MKTRSNSVAIAVSAHPDDIEFHMAGTLLLLKRAGYEIHYLNLASGNCGSSEHSGPKTRRMRSKEAKSAARVLGAIYHPWLTDDLEIVYNVTLLRKLTSILREVRPTIVLTHSPQDYMEDHTTTSRLSVTAAFARGMPNFRVTPPRPAVDQDVTVYHCMPHGLRDPLRRRVIPGTFVNTTPVYDLKLAALARHQSQQSWLDQSQGMNSYLLAMQEMSLEVGRLSGVFKHAEGWRRHSHLGFCTPEADPLKDALKGNCRINRKYEALLEAGH
jgi:LmbE family N-acetylglucosaminyl deacetylase